MPLKRIPPRIFDSRPLKSNRLESVRRYLVRHTTLSLATCQDNRPWSTDLFYASDDSCRLYFISDVTTRHCQDIAANPQVSVSISGQCAGWQEITGLQLDGVAEIVSGADRDQVMELYLTKFPELKRLHQASKLLKPLLESSVYRISPRWVRLIDNSKGFGHKEEMVF